MMVHFRFSQLIFTLSLLLLSSCKVEDSVNPMDPKGICGGIAASDVGPRIARQEARNPTLLADGINFELYTSLLNCSGRDLSGGEVRLESVKDIQANTNDIMLISKLSQNEESGFFLLSSMVQPINQENVHELIYSLTHQNIYKEYSHTLSVKSITPDFVMEMVEPEITDGEQLSNGDSLIDPGEKINFKIKITNLSDTKIKSFSIKIENNSSNYAVSGNSLESNGDLAGKTSIVLKQIYSIDVSSLVKRGDTPKFSVMLTDAFNHSWTKNINLTVSPLIPPSRAIQVLSLLPSQKINGFASDAKNWYILLKENITSTLFNWRILKKSPASSTFLPVCSFVSNNQEYSHLAIDDNFFYTMTNTSILKYSKDTCTFKESINPAIGVSKPVEVGTENQYVQSLHFDEGKLFFNSPNSFAFFNLQTNGSLNLFFNPSMEKIETLSDSVQFAVSKNLYFAYDRKNMRFWKFDSSGHALAWASTPSSSKNLLFNPVIMSALNTKTLLFINDTGNNQINFVTVDISNWENLPNQSLIYNEDESIINLGNNTFVGCGNNRFPTTTLGCMAYEGSNKLLMPLGQNLKGYTADQDSWFVLSLDDLGNNVKYWRLLKKDHSQNNFYEQCKMIHNGETYGNLTVDQDHFYVATGSGTIVKFKKNDCQAIRSYSPGNGYVSFATTMSYYNNNHYSFVVDREQIYRTTIQGISIFNTSNYTDNFLTFSQNLLGLNVSPKTGFYLGGLNSKWIYDDYNRVLWNLDNNYKALGWAQIPILLLPDLTYTKSVSLQGENKIVFLTEKDAGIFRFFTFDLSKFHTQNIKFDSNFLDKTNFVQTTISRCGQNEFMASNEKCIKLKEISTFPIPSGEYFKGLAFDGGKYYALSVNSTNKFTIHRRDLGSSVWKLHCSPFITTLKGHFTVDLSNFYIASSEGISRIAKNDCRNTNVKLYSYLISDKAMNFSYLSSQTYTLNISDGILYYLNRSNLISALNLSTNSTSTLDFRQGIGPFAISNEYGELLKGANGFWFADRSNRLVWRMDESGKAVSWFNLPISTFPDLSYTVQVESFDSNNLIFATDNGRGIVNLVMFDLSPM
jgi:hypothetical protein